MNRLRSVFLAVTLLGWLCFVPAGAVAQSQVTLTVEVVSGGGSTVGGADIVASWDGGERTVTTASNGRAFVDVPAGADVELTVEHEDFVRNGPVSVADADEREVTVDVSLKGNATMKVDEADGDPLEGATVELRRDGETVVEGETDSAGTFQTGVIEQGYYEATVFKPGYYRVSRRVPVRTDSEESFELERGSAQLDITVVDDHYEEPQELETARVRLTDADGEVATVRVDGGRATLGVPVNNRYTLTVLKEGYVEEQTTVDVQESDRTVRATTQRVANLTVERQNEQVVVGERTRLTVLDAYGDPVEGADIRYQGETVAETDASGDAVVTVEAAGPQEFHAVDGGVESQPVTVQGIDPEGDGGGTNVDSPTGTEEQAPGFGALAAALALLGAALLATRR